jgi:hypothetical protein
LFAVSGKKYIHKTFEFLLFRVIVSVVTMAGTECKLVELGQVAEITGGQVCKAQVERSAP